MYLASLYTPHTSRLAEGQHQQPLVDVLQLAGRQESLAQLEGTAAYAGALVTAMTDVRLGVKDALTWSTAAEKLESKDRPLETLASEQRTNCLGYATVLSEAYTEAAIDHYVAFGNGHAFVLAPTPDGWHYQDSMYNRLSGPAGWAIGSTREQIKSQIAEHGRGGVFINTRELAANAGQQPEHLEPRYSWLTYDSVSSLGPENLSLKRQSEKSHQTPYRFAVSLYEPQAGAAVLQAYDRFLHATRHADYATAGAALHAMRGRYPELDIRNPHQELKDIVGFFVGKDELGKAHTAIEDYFSSFAVSRDPRFPLAKGDILRSVAKQAGDRRAAISAVAAYGQALQRCKYAGSMIIGKLRRTQQLAEALA